MNSKNSWKRRIGSECCHETKKSLYLEEVCFFDVPIMNVSWYDTCGLYVIRWFLNYPGISQVARLFDEVVQNRSMEFRQVDLQTYIEMIIFKIHGRRFCAREKRKTTE